MGFLNSPNFSLACAIFNGAFCVHSLVNGSIGFALIGAAFAAICTNNYLKSR